MAEQNHRLRRHRDYDRSQQVLRGSFRDAVATLANRGMNEDDVNRLLEEVGIELVLTAHPTEALRRSVLDKHTKIAAFLEEMDDPRKTPRELTAIHEQIRTEIVALWQTRSVRKQRITVLDEVRNGLYFLDQILFDVLPHVHQKLEAAVRDQFGVQSCDLPSVIRFGSWMGGSRRQPERNSRDHTADVAPSLRSRLEQIRLASARTRAGSQFLGRARRR
nr:phosphoenolpyruvate carboxylase [Alicyclobacillus sacchari]